MWEYIGKIEKKIKGYKTGIAVTVCSLAMPIFIAGCGDLEDEEFWRKWKEDMAQTMQDVRQINSESRTLHVDHHGMPSSVDVRVSTPRIKVWIPGRYVTKPVRSKWWVNDNKGGHYEYRTRNERVWIPGHYEYRQ